MTDIHGVGPDVAAFLVGYRPPIERFTSADRYSAYNGTAPIEVSSEGRVSLRMLRRGNRTLYHAIHTVAVTQISHQTPGRVYGERRLEEGKTNKEALRALKRRILDAVYRRLVADAQQHDG